MLEEKIRINKYLSSTGICSRRAADDLISRNKVLINGKIAKLGDTVSEGDKVTVSGKQVNAPKTKKIYLAYNKPIGVITTSDLSYRDNIIQKVNFPERIFPIGRLDVASSGLILLTNDGDLAENLTRASNHHEKEYLVTVDKEITPEFLDKMASGVFILGRKTAKAKIVKISPKAFKLTLIEGRNRQIRRMCEALNYEVKKLQRIRIVNILLGELKENKWRYLTQKEEQDLKKNIFKN